MLFQSNNLIQFLFALHFHINIMYLYFKMWKKLNNIGIDKTVQLFKWNQVSIGLIW